MADRTPIWSLFLSFKVKPWTLRDRTPIWCSREARFRSNGVEYTGTEWFWSQQKAKVATQIGDTCVVHVMVRSTENKYLIHYKNKNQVPPFNRLSVEHVENRVATFIGLTKVLPHQVKYLATNVIRGEGILRDEDYCLPGGRRGQKNWKPVNCIPPDVPRFQTKDDEWECIRAPSDKTIMEKRQYLSDLIKEGPVYVDFFPSDDYDHIDDFSHGFKTPSLDNEAEMKKVQSHAVMLSGGLKV